MSTYIYFAILKVNVGKYTSTHGGGGGGAGAASVAGGGAACDATGGIAGSACLALLAPLSFLSPPAVNRRRLGW